MGKTDTIRLEGKIRDTIRSLEQLLERSSNGNGRSPHTVIADLVKRAEQPATIGGYPSRSPGAEVVSGGGTGDPVLAAVELRSEDYCGLCGGTGVHHVRSDGTKAKCRGCDGSGKRWADPVRDGVAEIVGRLHFVFAGVRRIDRKRAELEGAQSEPKGRPSTVGVCDGCSSTVTGHGEDRLKGGFGPCCYDRWRRWRQLNGDRDDPGTQRQQFIRFRQNQVRTQRDAASVEAVLERMDATQAAGALPVQ